MSNLANYSTSESALLPEETPDPEAPRRFEELARRLLAVPKPELDAELAKVEQGSPVKRTLSKGKSRKTPTAKPSR